MHAHCLVTFGFCTIVVVRVLFTDLFLRPAEAKAELDMKVRGCCLGGLRAKIRMFNVSWAVC